MGRLDELESFVKVVEEESFSEAARQLDISKSYVSKQIARLEDRLGARLLNRTTRQLTLTDVGEGFYERCVAILEELEEAERAVTDLQTSPKGTLRLSVPMSFGVMFLAPLIAEFMRMHPELSVDVTFADRVVNIVDEGFDLVVRIGQLKDSSLYARRLAITRSYLVASPEFVHEHGVPDTPHDLRDFRCLRYAYLSSGSMWRLTHQETGEEESVKIDGPLFANNGDLLREAACQGVGITLLPDFFITDEVETQRLVRVLPQWDSGQAGIWALYPHSRHLSTKVRLFVDHLVDTLDDPPWSEPLALAEEE